MDYAAVGVGHCDQFVSEVSHRRRYDSGRKKGLGGKGGWEEGSDLCLFADENVVHHAVMCRIFITLLRPSFILSVKADD